MDLQQHSGKQKYVARVLEDLPDEEIVSLAWRILERLPARRSFDLEDALSWVNAKGIARVTEVTRLRLAQTLDGWQLDPGTSPREVLAKFAYGNDSIRFEYAQDGGLCVVEQPPLDLEDAFAFLNPRAARRPVEPRVPKITRSSHLAMLDAYRFRDWPDDRLFAFVESLVHPTVRQGDDQRLLVQAINGVLIADAFELAEIDHVSGLPLFKVRPTVGVRGRPKNLIFSSIGVKPEIGFSDAVNNDVIILKHSEHCLIYDEPIGDAGLRWTKLVEWWATLNKLDASLAMTRQALADRLQKSLGSPPERRLFNAYFKVFRPRLREVLPALVPQVYLHYDPVTLKQLRSRGDERRFDVQRMDFLLLLPHGVRVVIEIDGQQHYATNSGPQARPSPEEYARTVRGDRRLRLSGYEVYRFGGHELPDDKTSVSVVDEFFTHLFQRHKLGPTVRER